MVRQEGLEPPALSLEGSCSVQLSYWRMIYSNLNENVTGIRREINLHNENSAVQMFF